MKLEGSCFCGAIKFETNTAASRVTHCHCIHCRRISGAPFLTYAEFKYADFTFTSGTPAQYNTRPEVTRQFCSHCGTQLTYRDSEYPHLIHVTIGSFDQSERLIPQDHIWSDRMLPWLQMDDGLPRYTRQRGF
jgi:hypothetical protein